jgi:hypothetical protein
MLGEAGVTVVRGATDRLLASRPGHDRQLLLEARAARNWATRSASLRLKSVGRYAGRAGRVRRGRRSPGAPITPRCARTGAGRRPGAYEEGDCW